MHVLCKTSCPRLLLPQRHFFKSSFFSFPSPNYSPSFLPQEYHAYNSGSLDSVVLQAEFKTYCTQRDGNLFFHHYLKMLRPKLLRGYILLLLKLTYSRSSPHSSELSTYLKTTYLASITTYTTQTSLNSVYGWSFSKQTIAWAFYNCSMDYYGR